MFAFLGVVTGLMGAWSPASAEGVRERTRLALRRETRLVNYRYSLDCAAVGISAETAARQWSPTGSWAGHSADEWHDYAKKALHKARLLAGPAGVPEPAVRKDWEARLAADGKVYARSTPRLDRDIALCIRPAHPRLRRRRTP